MTKYMFYLSEDEMLEYFCEFLNCDEDSVTADKIRLFLRDKLL